MSYLEQLAKDRRSLHTGHDSQHILAMDGDYIGVAAEHELARVFGLQMDTKLRSRGDGGRDNILSTADGDFVMDVKGSRIPWLLVRKDQIKPKTIYILAEFSNLTQTCCLSGWHWGSRLMRQPPKRWPRDLVNHFLPLEKTRYIEELLIAQYIKTSMNICKHCKARIIWGVTEKGHRVPVDPKPTEDGTIQLFPRPNNLPEAVVTKFRTGREGALYKSHFATCSQATELRKSGQALDIR